MEDGWKRNRDAALQLDNCFRYEVAQNNMHPLPANGCFKNAPARRAT
jgi:hypothetical protein